MSATASTLYPHVHQFLVQAGLTKTAEKFVKEAKFTPGDERPERDLLGIYNLYLANEPKKATKRKHGGDSEEKVATEEATEPKKKDKKKSKSEAAPAPVVVPEPAPVVEEPVEKKKKSKKSKDEPVAPAVSESDAEVVLPKKSNKLSEVLNTTKSSDASSSEASEATTPIANGNGKKSKGSRKATPLPFQRIDPGEKLDILPDHEFDANSIGCGTAWGQRANEKLSVTRGKGFRHEKTKAKRGTYRGGELETGVRSIKFD